MNKQIERYKIIKNLLKNPLEKFAVPRDWIKDSIAFHSVRVPLDLPHRSMVHGRVFLENELFDFIRVCSQVENLNSASVKTGHQQIRIIMMPI